MTNDEVLAFLQQYTLESRNIRLNFFDDLEGDISAADMGIRCEMQTPDRHYDELRKMIRRLKPNEILSIKDPMRSRFVFFRFGDGEMSFGSIGPFHATALENHDYWQIRSTFAPSTDVSVLQNVLSRVPNGISEMEVLSLARLLLLKFQGIAEPKVIRRDMEESGVPNDYGFVLSGVIGDANRANVSFNRQKRLCACIAAGNYEKALLEANEFIRSPLRRHLSSTQQSLRSILYAANTTFRITAQNAGTYPLYVDNLSHKFAEKISGSITESQLRATYLEMVEEYCKLCREIPARGCSACVQDVVNFIHLNLSNDMTLDSIAEAVNLSPAYFSRKFKEEMSVTPMAYITIQRIRMAKMLLVQTRLPIQEVAGYVGIADWNYFAKLFKKDTGMTPSAYRAEYNKSRTSDNKDS